MLAIEFNQFQANFFAEISMETDGGGGNSFGQDGIGGTRTTVHFMDRGQLSFRAHQPFMD